MNPTRLVFGVLLLSLCVFGLPEGCLVFAAHKAARPLPIFDTEPAGPELPGKQPEREASSLHEALTFSG